MEKQQVYIDKEPADYTCRICNRVVIVALATPRTFETDKSIIHTWDYGHEHKRVFAMVDGKQVLLEDTNI